MATSQHMINYEPAQASRESLPATDIEAHAPIHGDPLLVIDLNELAGVQRPPSTGAIVAGVDRGGLLPEGFQAHCDLLLTTVPEPPRPWVGFDVNLFDQTIQLLRSITRHRPIASSILAEVLRIGEQLEFKDSLTLEAFAYSTLLGGGEFRAWRSATSPRLRTDQEEPRVRFERAGDAVFLRVSRPTVRNAFDARMRDAMVEALRAIDDDPSVAFVILTSDGPDFCAGGDLGEFGSASDFGEAFAIRTLRSPAALVYKLRHKVAAHVHGCAIGAGIEIVAAAGHVRAQVGTWFQLPEIAMGLIPGAGGTATISRRIGRHRTLFLALSNERLTADRALVWGLIDEIADDGHS